eukprot:7105900-Prymnesium_polylepis.2
MSATASRIYVLPSLSRGLYAGWRPGRRHEQPSGLSFSSVCACRGTNKRWRAWTGCRGGVVAVAVGVWPRGLRVAWIRSWTETAPLRKSHRNRRAFDLEMVMA